MLGARRFDELATDPDPAARRAQAALDHTPHAEFPRDLLRISRVALVVEARIASHDGEPMSAPQFGNQILGGAVEKEFRLGISAEILKGSTPSAGRSGGAPLPRLLPGGGSPAFRQDTVDARGRRSFLTSDSPRSSNAIGRRSRTWLRTARLTRYMHCYGSARRRTR